MASKSRLPVASKKPVPVRIVNDGPAEIKSDSHDKWKIQDALRTIKDAEKFKADKTLMKGVKALAREEAKALDKIK